MLMLFLRTPSHLYPFSFHYAAPHSDRNLNLGLESGSLALRLRLDPVKDKDFVPLPGPLLRKYIAYARQFIFPR